MAFLVPAISSISTATSLGIKSGKKIPVDFSGSPRKATVVFITPYSDINYAVTFDVVTLGNNYAPVAEDKTINGFKINLGSSNIGGMVEVLWQAMPIAE